jgi:hypothetical protein
MLNYVALTYTMTGFIPFRVRIKSFQTPDHIIQFLDKIA